MQSLETYQNNLEADLKTITAELHLIAILDEETGDWVIRTDDIDQTQTDLNAQADASEEADERIAVLAELENRYNLIKHALKKFALGTYGICELTGNAIEVERLAANPTARTCTEHMDNEHNLPLS